MTDEENKSETVTLGRTLSMVPGTKDFLSYTPYYNHYRPYCQCRSESEGRTWQSSYSGFTVELGAVSRQFSIVAIN